MSVVLHIDRALREFEERTGRKPSAIRVSKREWRELRELASEIAHYTVENSDGKFKYQGVEIVPVDGTWPL